MNEQALADRIRTLAPTDNNADWADILQRAATAPPATRPRLADRPLRRRWFLVAASAAVAAIIAGVVFGLTAGSTRQAQSTTLTPDQKQLQAFQVFLKSHPQLARRMRQRQRAYERIASRSIPGSTGIRTLLAYTRTEHAVNASDLPASVDELVGMEETFLTGGQAPISIEEPIVGTPSSGTPSIYLVTYPNNLCMLISIKGAVGSCYVALRDADGSISLDDSVVDGKHFVHGLVADNVSSVTVTLAATATTAATTVPATITNNIFIAPLPSEGGSIAVSVTRTDGSTDTVQIPSPPRPAPHAAAVGH